MNSPKFSFIVPVYNGETYIQDCLESILNQTVSDFEVILIDDGSTDGSFKIIDDIIYHKDNCHFLRNEHGGVCKARNTGIESAKGQYLCFVDADDVIYYDYLEKLDEAIRLYDPDVIYFYAKYGINNKERNSYDKDYISLSKKDIQLLACASLYHIPEYSDSSSVFYNINSFSSWGQVYRKDIFNTNNIRFEEGISLSEDGLINLELLQFVDKGVIICNELYNYRLDNISATRSYKDTLIEVFKKRDDKVKDIFIQYKLSEVDSYLINYYNSLFYELRIICQNYLFHKNNRDSYWVRRRKYIKIISRPDYKKALDICSSSYLLEEDKKFFAFAKKKEVLKMALYVSFTGSYNVFCKNAKKLIKGIIKYGK